MPFSRSAPFLLCSLFLGTTSVSVADPIPPYTDHEARQNERIEACRRKHLDLDFDVSTASEWKIYGQGAAIICELAAQDRSLGDNPTWGEIDHAQIDALVGAMSVRTGVLRGFEGDPPCDPEVETCYGADRFSNVVILRTAAFYLSYIIYRFPDVTWSSATKDALHLTVAEANWIPEATDISNQRLTLTAMRIFMGKVMDDSALVAWGRGQLHQGLERAVRHGSAEPMSPHYAGANLKYLAMMTVLEDEELRGIVESLLGLNLLISAHLYLPGGGLGAPQNREKTGGAIADPHPRDDHHMINSLNILVGDPELPYAEHHPDALLASSYQAPEIIRSIFLDKGSGYTFRYRAHTAQEQEGASVGWYAGRRDYPSMGHALLHGQNVNPWQAVALPGGRAQLGLHYGSGSRKATSSSVYVRATAPGAFSILVHQQPGHEDVDDDGVDDLDDNCPVTPNSSQLDVDGDGAGNACDCDFNQDGLCDVSDALRFLNDFCADNDTFVEPPIDCTATENQNQGPETNMDGEGLVSLEDSALYNANVENGGPGEELPSPPVDPTWRFERKSAVRRMLEQRTQISIFDSTATNIPNAAPTFQYTMVHLPNFADPTVGDGLIEIASQTLPGASWFVGQSGNAYVAFLPLGTVVERSDRPDDHADPPTGALYSVGSWIYLKLEGAGGFITGDITELATTDEFPTLQDYANDLAARHVSFGGTTPADAMAEVDLPAHYGSKRIRLEYADDARFIEDVAQADGDFLALAYMIDSPFITWDESTFELKVNRPPDYDDLTLYLGDPTIPTTVSGLGVDSEQAVNETVRLSWHEAHDDVAVVDYDVYRDGVWIGSETSASNEDVSPSNHLYQETHPTDQSGLTRVARYQVAARDADVSVSPDGNVSPALSDFREVVIPETDADADGAGDFSDNCPATANSSQLDVDADGTGNACDCDFNQDGLCDVSDALRFRNDFCADNGDFDDGTIDCTTAEYQNQGPETNMDGEETVSLEDRLLFEASAPNLGWSAIAAPALPGAAGIVLLAVALLGAGSWRLRFPA